MSDSRLSQIGNLISPSLLSGLLTIFLSLGVLAISLFSYTSGSGLIYDYLFGPNSSAELIRSASGSVDAFTNTVFGNSTLNKILFFCFWMVIGLIVYLILYLVFKGTSEAAQDIQEAGYVNSRGKELLRAIETRLAVRTVVIVIWAVYWVFFVKTLVPFSILSGRVGGAAFPAPNGWIYSGLGLIVLVLSIHIHLIFLRLTALKLRLFSS